MKLFQRNTNNTPSSPLDTSAAALLMDVVPQIMDWIRTEMRNRRSPGLSIPQFRTLIYLYRHENVSLSQVSEHIGLKLPSSSKIVDALVIRKLIIRNVSQEDRRCTRLRLSAIGRDELLRTWHTTESQLSEKLSLLSSEQQSVITGAIQTLQRLFASGKSEVQDKNVGNEGKTTPGGEIGR